jgi:hypothetical protein
VFSHQTPPGIGDESSSYGASTHARTGWRSLPRRRLRPAVAKTQGTSWRRFRLCVGFVQRYGNAPGAAGFLITFVSIRKREDSLGISRLDADGADIDDVQAAVIMIAGQVGERMYLGKDNPQPNWFAESDHDMEHAPISWRGSSGTTNWRGGFR